MHVHVSVCVCVCVSVYIYGERCLREEYTEEYILAFVDASACGVYGTQGGPFSCVSCIVTITAVRIGEN